MSECIRINGVEHLSVERTLLVHYSILCSGLWDLNQEATAYRNICDTEWTIMYPNFQHPRHTDFPINLAAPGFQGTFAWNYDGIYGIDPENFDEGHSYLVQLSIFNFSCLYTGDATGQPGTSGGSIPTEPSDTTIPPIIIYPPFPPALPPPPRTPDPPVPGNPRVPRVPIDIPYYPSDPRPKPPTDTIPPNSPRIPILVDSIPPLDPVPPTQSFEPGVIFPGRPIDLTPILTPAAPTAPNRPVDYIPGHIGPTRFVYSITDLDPSIVSPPSIPNDTQQGTNRRTIDLFDESHTSTVLGQRTVAEPPGYRTINNQVSIRQINASNILSNAITTLTTNVNDATIGSAIVVAGSFLPPTDIQISATANLYLMDSTGITNLIATSSNTNITSSNPLQIGISVSTSNLALGQATFVLTITQNDTVIGVATKAVGIRNIQAGSVSSSTEIPGPLSSVSVNPIIDEPILMNFSGPITLVIDNTSTNNSFTAFYTAAAREERLSLAVYNLTTTGTITTSSTPAVLNNIEYSPETHNVGLINSTVSLSSFGLTIQPTTNSDQINGKLYLADGFNLKEWSTTSVTASSLTIQSPYANRSFKLLIHGYRENYIPSSYTLKSAVSNSLGVVTFTGLSLAPGYWFSVIDEGSNNYNVNTNIVYTDIYD